jgi:hypothetical protein
MRNNSMGMGVGFLALKIIAIGYTPWVCGVVLHLIEPFSAGFLTTCNHTKPAKHRHTTSHILRHKCLHCVGVYFIVGKINFYDDFCYDKLDYSRSFQYIIDYYNIKKYRTEHIMPLFPHLKCAKL